MARWLYGPAHEAVTELKDKSVDLILTSPPYFQLRQYLPPEHPMADYDFGCDPSPAHYIESLLIIINNYLRDKLTDDGSLVIDIGDSYSWSGGAGGDWRKGKKATDEHGGKAHFWGGTAMAERQSPGELWPNHQSMMMIPEALAIGLAYGINPLSTTDIPIEKLHEERKWTVRNIVRVGRSNPRPGRQGDKYTPATSHLIIAHKGIGKRVWNPPESRVLDHWTVGVKNTNTSHQAPWAMEDVIKECILSMSEVGSTVLDPFAGSGTVLKVAEGLGRNAIGIDLVDWSEQETT